MLKKTIKYTDYNDVERTEDFYFNISKAELIMMDSEVVGGMRQHLERISQTQDNVAIMEVFKDLIHRSYGERSPDGKRFVKSEEMATAFEQTEAYSELVMELLSNPEVAANFVNAILPKGLVDEAAKEAAKTASSITELPPA